MIVVTTSARGQIVIPKEIRKKLKIVPGKKLLVKLEGDQIYLTLLPDDPVAAFCGVFADGPSLTGELIGERQKEREREEKKIAG